MISIPAVNPDVPERFYPADFSQLEKVFRCEKPDRPVLFEYFTNARLISLVNGKPFPGNEHPETQICEIIRFFHTCGYDHATIPARYFTGFSFKTGSVMRKSTVSLNEAAVITGRESFNAYQWPDPEQIDTRLLHDMAGQIPARMKLIITGPGGLLENVINLVGFERLCFMILEDEELAIDIFDAVGSRLCRFYEICSRPETVGALIVNDDWGFKTQTMLSPDMLRQLVFPWTARMAGVIHQHERHAILHSCGNICEIMDDIINDLRFDAKHSFEDAILPVEEAYRKLHPRISILGGIDMDLLARGKPDEISERCRNLLKMTSSKGYALGSGNSIPEYIPPENFFAMIKTVGQL
jgi:uroporphyrinogen decarboxylase